MGKHQPKEEGAARRPVGFWSPFNDWWRKEYQLTGRRPRAQDVNKWYQNNADAVWGEQKPTWVDAREHAKCLRSPEEVREYFRAYRANKKVQEEDRPEKHYKLQAQQLKKQSPGKPKRAVHTTSKHQAPGVSQLLLAAQALKSDDHSDHDEHEQHRLSDHHSVSQGSLQYPQSQSDMDAPVLNLAAALLQQPAMQALLASSYTNPLAAQTMASLTGAGNPLAATLAAQANPFTTQAAMTLAAAANPLAAALLGASSANTFNPALLASALSQSSLGGSFQQMNQPSASSSFHQLHSNSNTLDAKSAISQLLAAAATSNPSILNPLNPLLSQLQMSLAPQPQPPPNPLQEAQRALLSSFAAGLAPAVTGQLATSQGLTQQQSVAWNQLYKLLSGS